MYSTRPTFLQVQPALKYGCFAIFRRPVTCAQLYQGQRTFKILVFHRNSEALTPQTTSDWAFHMDFRVKTQRQTGEEGRRGLLSNLIIFALVYTLTECRGDNTDISLGKQSPLGSLGGQQLRKGKPCADFWHAGQGHISLIEASWRILSVLNPAKLMLYSGPQRASEAQRKVPVFFPCHLCLHHRSMEVSNQNNSTHFFFVPPNTKCPLTICQCFQ